MLFQKKVFKGSKILSTITSYAGRGGNKKKKASDTSETLQVFKQGNKLRITGKPNQTQQTKDNVVSQKSQICGLTAAKLALAGDSAWNIPNNNNDTSSLRLPQPLTITPSSPRVQRQRTLQKKPTSPNFSSSFNSSHPAFKSSLYNFNKLQMPRRLGRNTNERIFSNMSHPLQSIQECEDENLY